jgi:hypothetical protein
MFDIPCISLFPFIPIVRGKYPTLAALPVITAVAPSDQLKASSSVHLMCTFAVDDTGQYPIKFIVTWFKVMYFIGGNSGRLVLLRQKTTEQLVVIDYDTADFSLGDTVCKQVFSSR